MFHMLDVEKVRAEFFVADLIGRLVVRLGELADGPDIDVLGARRPAAQLQVFDPALLQWGHGVPPWVAGMESVSRLKEVP
ncbi:MAG: hypothetical protein L0387_21265 [Acidobacteria bacterium]|nr:hypothetical protein [Acidobacteriota bacterium]